MTGQQTLDGHYPSDDRFYYIFYREIQAHSPDLSEEIFVGEDALDVESLLNDILKTAGGKHPLSALDTTRYFDRWVNRALNAPDEIEPGDSAPERVVEVVENIAEDFSDNMKTRAKQKGKYVISILGKHRFVVCHSYTGKQALTTDMEVIEELLSPDNIDKYAEFSYGAEADKGEETVQVDHFDKHDTESFIEWLGISDDEIVFDVKGDVKLYSKINGEIETVFELTREDVVEKLINSDRYRLSQGMFETPGTDTPTYRIDKIRWGGQIYEDTEKFKQEALSRHYELKYYQDKYEDLTEDLEAAMPDTLFDEEKAVVRRNRDSKEVRFKKSHDDFHITCVNEKISLDTGWKKELATKPLTSAERYPIHHPGNQLQSHPSNSEGIASTMTSVSIQRRLQT